MLIIYTAWIYFENHFCDINNSSGLNGLSHLLTIVKIIYVNKIISKGKIMVTMNIATGYPKYDLLFDSVW